jgi:hypothetical protein
MKDGRAATPNEPVIDPAPALVTISVSSSLHLVAGGSVPRKACRCRRQSGCLGLGHYRAVLHKSSRVCIVLPKNIQGSAPSPLSHTSADDDTSGTGQRSARDAAASPHTPGPRKLGLHLYCLGLPAPFIRSGVGNNPQLFEPVFGGWLHLYNITTGGELAY